MARKKSQVFHFDVYGKRDEKYNFLNENSIRSIEWTELYPQEPELFFVPKDYETKNEYDKGFNLTNLYKINSLGLLTKKDSFIIDFNKKNLEKRLSELSDFEKTDDEISKKYGLKLKDNDRWNLNKARQNINKKGIDKDQFIKINYRCFDKRWIYYNEDFVARLNTKVLDHVNTDSPALITTRQLATDYFFHIFISELKSDQCFISNKTKEGCQVFPLYYYPNWVSDSVIKEARVPNFNMEIIDKIAEILKLDFVPDDMDIPEEYLIYVEAKLSEDDYRRPHDYGYHNCFTPIDILDYIYAVLHSPAYRDKYKEFLKIDFPRVPYPKDAESFWELVTLGGRLRELHLLESEKVEQYITQYPMDGNNVVGKVEYRDGRVYINEEQYFDHVPAIAWEFYIGGYQPAQKWLKDRKDRALDFEDILHYQKMIVALTETDRLMQEIDAVGV